MPDRIRIWLAKFYSDWQKINISAAYFIVRTDKIFKISLNDWHVKKDFDISVTAMVKILPRCVYRRSKLWRQKLHKIFWEKINTNLAKNGLRMHHLHPFFIIFPGGHPRTSTWRRGSPLPHPPPAALRADLVTPHGTGPSGSATAVRHLLKMNFTSSGMNTLTRYEARRRTGERPEYEHVPFVMVISWPRTRKSVAHESKNQNNELKCYCLWFLIEYNMQIILIKKKMSKIRPILKKLCNKRTLMRQKIIFVLINNFLI